MNRSALATPSLIALAAFLLFAAASFPSRAAAASPTYVLNGYAWSDTVGWISMNCETGGSDGSSICAKSDYAIMVDGNGDLSGYGWSDNVGWVSADTDDLANCPSGACAAKLADKKLTGWLRAVSGGTAESGGWDGFVSLGGPVQSGGSYGITLAGSVFSGFAWGDMNIGWTDFSLVRLEPCSGSQCIRARPPQCSVKFPGAWRNTIQRGTATTLAYVSNRVSSGGSFDIANFKPVSPNISGSGTVSPTETTDYTGTVYDEAKKPKASCPATLRVCAQQPGCSCNGVNLVCVGDGGACNRVVTNCAALGQQCRVSGGGNAECVAEVPQIGVHLRATPSLVRSGTPSNLYWDVSGVASCAVQGSNGQIFHGLSSGSGGIAPQPTAPITQQTIYTLTCLPAGALPTESATINIVPTFHEL